MYCDASRCVQQLLAYTDAVTTAAHQQYGWYPEGCTRSAPVLCEVPKTVFPCAPSPPARPPPPNITPCKFKQCRGSAAVWCSLTMHTCTRYIITYTRKMPDY
jgi:hypothetical protein